MNYKGSDIKMYRFILLVWIFIGISFTEAQGQNSSYVKNFDAQLINGKIHLGWYTRAGFTCNDIHIKLSNDSVSNFETVGSIYGVCGDTSEKYYSYTLDAPLKNTTNFIKLELGIFGYSDLISLYVFDTESQVSITPHPIESSSILYFTNELKDEAVVSFFSSRGDFIESITTTDDELRLGTLNLPIGTTYYTIQVASSYAISGKLIRQ